MNPKKRRFAKRDAKREPEEPTPILTKATLDLSIIIVSWNVRELLADCLRSVDENRGRLDLEVIVVDSASNDGSPETVRDEFPWVRLHACPENVGFPRGNNLAMRMAYGRYLLLLNPDTVVLDDALTQMLTYLEDHKDVGVVGGQLLNADGTIQSSRRRFPTLITAVFESTWLQSHAPTDVLRRFYMEDIADDMSVEVDWLVGACLMVRREVILDVGLMDEAYFMYSEELDWCRRIKEAGWRIVYLPAAHIVHYIGQSSDQAVTERHINFQRAKLRYFSKYHGPRATGFLRVALLLNYIWQLAVETGKYVLGHRRALRRQRMYAYVQVIRSRLPPAGH
ncbi:MAG: glycosyltransferase family 2 protein [Chloroflexota bacterium]|nr:MAG: glycosyltransferase family 2 protein [Chloroflexota bacterium]